jgi:hypothetical protein
MTICEVSQMSFLDELGTSTCSAEESPVSRGALPARETEPTTSEIYGLTLLDLSTGFDQNSFAWKMSLALQSQSWASPEFALTWRRVATRSGCSIFRLAPSARRRSERGSGSRASWPTATATDAAGSRGSTQDGAKALGPNRNAGTTLTDAAFATWPTPQTVDAGTSRQPRLKKGEADRDGRDQSSPGNLRSDLKELVAASVWPTPAARDHKGIDTTQLRDHNARPLNEVAAWATPHGNSCKGPGNASGNGDNLQTMALSAWATPSAGLHNYDEDSASFQARSERLVAQGTRPLGANLGQEALGTMPNGCPAWTASIEGFRLNPLFSLWLMGFPEGWLDSRLWETRSSLLSSSASAAPCSRPPG